MFTKFSDSLKRETGFDARNAVEEMVVAGGSALRNVERELQRFRDEIVPGVVEWNQLQQWKVSCLFCTIISRLHFIFVNWSFLYAFNGSL